MIDNFIPDYSKYDTESLIDIYSKMHRENNPLRAEALDNEIKKRLNLPPETKIDSQVVMGFLNAVQEKTPNGKTVPNKNEEMIRQGWIAGVVVGSITLLTWMLAMLRQDTEVNGAQYSVYTLIDILAIFGLSFGISRKSRVCAVILAAYFIIIKLIQMTIYGFPQIIWSAIGLLIFGSFLVRAVFGTYNYHKGNKKIVQETV